MCDEGIIDEESTNENKIENSDNNCEKKPQAPTGKVKKFIKRYFIDAFSGMALGLFCTLIIGTIIGQIGSIIGDNVVGNIFSYIGTAAKIVMGAGIGVGIASNLGGKKLTIFSCAAAGMIGANITNIFAMSGVSIWGVDASKASITIGDPVSAYIASIIALEIGNVVEGRTKVDIILVPLACIFAGSIASIVVGIPFSMLFTLLGKAIALATEIEPISMGIIVAVAMGLLLTFPTSSAAFGYMLFSNAQGIGAQLAAGAAVAGCAAHMIGFAVASFRENKWGGLISQGLGTSMLQIPNLAKNPKILIPAICASIVAGPMSSAVFRLLADATGSGMGTAGLVGIFRIFDVSMASGMSWWYVLIGTLVCNFIIPAVVAFVVSEFMRKKNWIKFGDMKLSV